MFEKNLARALRRHHAARLKSARAQYWGRRWVGPNGFEPMTERQLGMVVATPAICSCGGCGNPRKWLRERSVQEQAWAQESVDQLLQDQDAEGSGEA